MYRSHSSTPMRIYAAAIASAAWFALILQFPLTIATSRANGIGFVAATVTYFSFFTILTNLLIAVGITIPLFAPNSRWGTFFCSSAVTAAMAVYILMVGAGYSLLLRNIVSLEGLRKVTDVIMHDAVPPMYLVYWLISEPKDKFRWKNLLTWLIYPLVYLLFVLIRGALIGRYPYPFVDVNTLGFAHVLLNAAMLLCALLAVGALVIVYSRWAGRNSPADEKYFN
jgi:hypothetical protein